MIGIGYAPGAFDLFHIGICCLRPGSAFFGIIRPERASGFESKDRSVSGGNWRHHRCRPYKTCKKMTATPIKTLKPVPLSVADDARWARIVARDKTADGHLWYSSGHGQVAPPVIGSSRQFRYVIIVSFSAEEKRDAEEGFHGKA